MQAPSRGQRGLRGTHIRQAAAVGDWAAASGPEPARERCERQRPAGRRWGREHWTVRHRCLRRVGWTKPVRAGGIHAAHGLPLSWAALAAIRCSSRRLAGIDCAMSASTE